MVEEVCINALNLSEGFAQRAINLIGGHYGPIITTSGLFARLGRRPGYRRDYDYRRLLYL